MNESIKNIFVVLHDVHAVSKVSETAQVVYGFGFHNFVISKAEGSAAQSGVPDANRFALKMKRSFMVLPSLNAVKEVLEVEKPLLITSPVLTKTPIDFDRLTERIESGERIVIVLSGSNSSFSRKEMDQGECASLLSQIDIGPSGTAAVILYEILKSLRK